MLFRPGSFISHSGKRLNWKIECDTLTDDDLAAIAEMVAKEIKFAGVIGIPHGGIRIANALCKYSTIDSEVILLVDDVLTTGKSMEEVRASYLDEEVQGLVIFARGKCPDWIIPVFQLDQRFI